MATEAQKPTTLAEALVMAQSQIDAPKKTAENPHFRNKFAPLDELLNVSKPVLNALGVGVFQPTITREDGWQGIKTIFVGYGETIDMGDLLGPPESDPQKLGSRLTYFRRYGLAAALGLAAEDDDDANGASGKTAPPSAPANPAPQVAGSVDRKILSRIYAKRMDLDISDAAFLARLRSAFGDNIERDNDMTAAQADNVLKRLIAAEKMQADGDTTWRTAWPEPAEPGIAEVLAEQFEGAEEIPFS